MYQSKQSQPSKPIFVAGLILLFAAMVAPLASHAKGVSVKAHSQPITIVTPVGAFYSPESCYTELVPGIVTIDPVVDYSGALSTCAEGQFVFDSDVTGTAAEGFAGQVTVVFEGVMTWQFYGCQQINQSYTFACSAPFSIAP